MNLWHNLSQALSAQGIFWTAVIMGLSVTLHELAHYAAAKRQGVAVPYFSVGMGPVLWKRQWRGTEWRISALPLGGYVHIEGMGINEDGSSPTHGYAALKPWGQIKILLLAPLTNLLIAFVMLTGLYTHSGLTTPINNQILISQVLEGSHAEQLGLRAGDIITTLDGQALPQQGSAGQPGWQKLSELLRHSGRHQLGVTRGTQQLNVAFDWQAKVGGQPQKLGVAYGPAMRRTPLSLPQAAAQAGQDMAQALPRTLEALKTLLTRILSLNLQPDNGIVGPIGTAQAVTQAAKLGAEALLGMAMAINLGLGLLNLLPIPGLDGGHILLIVLGWLRGRPLSLESYQRLTLGGFAVLLSLGLFVFVRDILRVMQ